VATAFGAAILSAVCYGLASALQAYGVRSGGAGRSADAHLTLRVLSRLPFVVGILLHVAGFGAQLLALRGLPVFVVQAAQAGNLAVTALAAEPPSSPSRASPPPDSGRGAARSSCVGSGAHYSAHPCRAGNRATRAGAGRARREPLARRRPAADFHHVSAAARPPDARIVTSAQRTR
jgi:hypothetical protein